VRKVSPRLIGELIRQFSRPKVGNCGKFPERRNSRITQRETDPEKIEKPELLPPQSVDLLPQARVRVGRPLPWHSTRRELPLSSAGSLAMRCPGRSMPAFECSQQLRWCCAKLTAGWRGLKWSRFSEQIFRIDKWSLCQGSGVGGGCAIRRDIVPATRLRRNQLLT
jgi:hypothetical protein